MQSNQLPFSLEAEQSLLGGMLINSDIIPQVKLLLDIDDLYLERHQALGKILPNVRRPPLFKGGVWKYFAQCIIYPFVYQVKSCQKKAAPRGGYYFHL